MPTRPMVMYRERYTATLPVPSVFRRSDPAMIRACFATLISLILAGPAFAQSQAANGSIEGTVVDTSGGVLPGVTVTVTNVGIATGRLVVTKDKVLYRALLLPLG